jgi:hypothetical protein
MEFESLGMNTRRRWPSESDKHWRSNRLLQAHGDDDCPHEYDEPLTTEK